MSRPGRQQSEHTFAEAYRRDDAPFQASSLDALHLAPAERVGVRAIPILTFDLRSAQAARCSTLPRTGCLA
jgi:hypothetical protein